MEESPRPTDGFAVAAFLVAIAGIIGAVSFPNRSIGHSDVLDAALGVGSAIIAAGAMVAWAILRRGR